MSQPKYKHDCDKCEFVGHFDGYDTYVCVRNIEGKMSGSIVLRCGNDGPEYSSFPITMLGYSKLDSVNIALANFVWCRYQNQLWMKSGKDVQVWCDFINGEKMYKEIFC